MREGHRSQRAEGRPGLRGGPGDRPLSNKAARGFSKMGSEKFESIAFIVAHRCASHNVCVWCFLQIIVL